MVLGRTNPSPSSTATLILWDVKSFGTAACFAFIPVAGRQEWCRCYGAFQADVFWLSMSIVTIVHTSSICPKQNPRIRWAPLRLTGLAKVGCSRRICPLDPGTGAFCMAPMSDPRCSTWWRLSAGSCFLHITTQWLGRGRRPKKPKTEALLRLRAPKLHGLLDSARGMGRESSK